MSEENEVSLVVESSHCPALEFWVGFEEGRESSADSSSQGCIEVFENDLRMVSRWISLVVDLVGWDIVLDPELKGRMVRQEGYGQTERLLVMLVEDHDMSEVLLRGVLTDLFWGLLLPRVVERVLEDHSQLGQELERKFGWVETGGQEHLGLLLSGNELLELVQLLLKAEDLVGFENQVFGQDPFGFLSLWIE
jgi:hypothetical protein